MSNLNLCANKICWELIDAFGNLSKPKLKLFGNCHGLVEFKTNLHLVDSCITISRHIITALDQQCNNSMIRLKSLSVGK